mmetsp:Transcript_28243/g.55002  ORF Transcript_28243/g.55002 Transcript_28243/m.55002 type:complete len:166 (+) Transcript_28243:265-762(+)
MEFVAETSAAAENEQFRIVHSKSFHIPSWLQSFPGIAHGGGAFGTIVDDTAFWCLFYNTGSLAVTTSMTINFKRPVRVDGGAALASPSSSPSLVVASARLDTFDRKKTRKAIAEVVVREAQEGKNPKEWPVVCTGTVSFFVPPGGNSSLKRILGRVVDRLPKARM